MFDLPAYDALTAALTTATLKPAAFSDCPDAGLLLRLDVDYDLDWAVQTAEINARRGIRAAYFVLIGGDFYNPFSRDGRNALKALAKLGQDVGLHHHHWDEESPPDQARIRAEFNALRSLCDACVPVVAWHNPPADLSALTCTARDMGLIDAYDPKWFGPECYRSDSNLRCTPQDLAHFACGEGPALRQILLHPFNWTAGGARMDEILRKTWLRQADLAADRLNANRVWRDGARKPCDAALAALKRDLTQ